MLLVNEKGVPRSYFAIGGRPGGMGQIKSRLDIGMCRVSILHLWMGRCLHRSMHDALDELIVASAGHNISELNRHDICAMLRTLALWVISLLVSGCTITGPGYVTTGLQPNNCGTLDQFKNCTRNSRVGVVRPARPLVVVEELIEPAREAPAPWPDNLIDYSRLSVSEHAPLTAALSEPSPEGE